MSDSVLLLRRLENDPANYYKLVQVYRMKRSGMEGSEFFEYLSDALSAFKHADIDLLMCFNDPLAAVTDAWYRYQTEMGGYDDVRDFLEDVAGHYDYDDDFDLEDD